LALPANHTSVLSTQTIIAELLRWQGRYAEALQCLDQAIKLNERLTIEDERVYSVMLNNRGLLKWSLADFASSEESFREALALKQVISSDSGSVATTLVNLASLYVSGGRWDDAERLIEEALALITLQYGESHVRLAPAQCVLSIIRRYQKRYSEAADCCKVAIAAQEQALGMDHPEIGMSLTHLAETYRLSGRSDEAQKTYQRALTIITERLGPTHPAMVNVLNNFGLLYIATKQYDEAVAVLQRAVSIAAGVLGERHTSCLNAANSLA
jgi:tetratricopeptide (TPR) repeat protein